MMKNRYLKQSVIAAGVIATFSLTGCKVSEDEFAEFLQTTDEATLIETCQDNRGDCMNLLSQDKFQALLSESQVAALCMTDDTLCSIVSPQYYTVSEPVMTVEAIAEAVTVVEEVPPVPVFDFASAFNAVQSIDSTSRQLVAYEALSARDDVTDTQRVRVAAASVITAIKAGEDDKPYRQQLLAMRDARALPDAIQGLVYWAAIVEDAPAPRTFKPVIENVNDVIAAFDIDTDYERDPTLAAQGYLRAAIFESFRGNQNDAARYVLASVDKQKMSNIYLPVLSKVDDVRDLRRLFLAGYFAQFSLNDVFTV